MGKRCIFEKAQLCVSVAINDSVFRQDWKKNIENTQDMTQKLVECESDRWQQRYLCKNFDRQLPVSRWKLLAHRCWDSLGSFAQSFRVRATTSAAVHEHFDDGIRDSRFNRPKNSSLLHSGLHPKPLLLKTTWLCKDLTEKSNSIKLKVWVIVDKSLLSKLC